MKTTSGALRSEKSFRRRPAGALTLAALVLAAIGCGSSSSSESTVPGEKFLGRWELDTVPSTFNLACASGQGQPGASLWFELNFERGVLTDLTEASGACAPNGMGFNVDTKGTVISAVVPDPYSPTGAAPSCILNAGTDASGNPAVLALSFSMLTLTELSSAPNTAPAAILSGNATGTVTVQDLMTGATSTLDTCTYGGTSDRYHQMTRP